MSHLFPVEDSSPDDEFEELPEDDPVSESQARASLHGKEFDADAIELLEGLGATVVERYPRVHNYRFDAEIEGENGVRFLVGAYGTPDRTDRDKAGMKRTDTMLKFGFKALRLRQHGSETPILLITSHLPREGTQGAFYLSELNDVLLDAVAIDDLRGHQRLRTYFTQDGPIESLPAPWRSTQLNLELGDA